jgi:hypothetical protein
MTNDMIVEDGGGRVRRERVNYPNNSNKAKVTGAPEKPLLERVTNTDTVIRKRPFIKRVGTSMMAEDGGSVVQYILTDVLLPAAKNMISDAISQGIDRLLFGDARPRRGDTKTGYTNYSKVSRPAGYESRSELSQARANHDFSYILIQTRVEAEMVIDRLNDLISQFGEAKVTDLYDLIGATGSFTDQRWGWTDFRDARVKPVRGGYALDLPRVQALT